MRSGVWGVASLRASSRSPMLCGSSVSTVRSTIRLACTSARLHATNAPTSLRRTADAARSVASTLLLSVESTSGTARRKSGVCFARSPLRDCQRT